jgi:anti-sigma factor (TIGR02949 family)
MSSAAPTCRVVKRHVDALVDGELDSSAQIDFEKHLAGCVICREHAMFAQSMKRATKSALGEVKAPEHLRLRVLTALDSAAPRPQRLPPVRRSEPDSKLVRYGLPVAAAAVVALGFATQTDESADTLSLEAAAAPVWQDVVRRHEREHPAEVQGSPQQMATWFQRKLEFAARPVDFGAQADAQLVGGRISNVRERDAAAFYYQVHGHRVTVMVFEPPPETFRGAEHVYVQGHDVYYRNVHGYTVPMTQMGGLTYAFTSDMDRDAMIRLAASAHVGN